MVGNKLAGVREPRLRRAGSVSDQLLPGEPVRGRQLRHACSPTTRSRSTTRSQVQFRKRYAEGLELTANYTFGRARTDRYVVGADGIQDYHTLRDKSLEWGPTAYDLRHNFQTYGTYDLPFGTGRAIHDRQRRDGAGVRRLGGVGRRCASRPAGRSC